MITFFAPIEFSTLFRVPTRPQRQYVPAKAVPAIAKKVMMSLGRKVRAMVLVAVLGLECDGDKYDWKRGSQKGEGLEFEQR